MLMTVYALRFSPTLPCSYTLVFFQSFVWSYESFDDLCTDDINGYYSGAVPIIESQIAKQGYRLAAWLNVLFDGDTNLP